MWQHKAISPAARPLPVAHEAPERGRSRGYLRRAGVPLIVVFTGTALVLSLPLASDILIDRLQVFPALTATELVKIGQGPPTAIVILSAGRRTYAPEYGGETVDELALERLRYGAEVARATQLPVLVSGGMGNSEDPPHARLMADVLSRDYGIAAKWQEALSTNTAENAIYSSNLLKRAGIGRVILITHAWHMKRARDAFVANGMTVIPAPTAFYGHLPEYRWTDLIPNMRAFRMSGYAIHETLGSQWYTLRYGY